ncbi:hypothetical protein HC031_13730 [Planosporangium thailandense]|uniref:Helix-turn-helix domain-containing protein n=1 Tax=Planosporangium thailandense TaxID=765197 RepID=A0ABX0XZV7_9ACTN|nr:hypothetical protein [Planosporangium thailandense]NJC70767.1 hypothetical protein [Planosporangium thailandense]
MDTTSGNARVTELTVRAPEGGAIFPQQLPAINLDQLIAALAPPTTTAIEATPTPSEHSDAPAQTEASAPVSADLPASEADGSAPQASSAPQPIVPSPRAGRPSQAKKPARTAPAKKALSRSRQSKAERAAVPAQSATGRRAYRRMPEPAEVLAAYREVGGTTALARHYGVPRHTATGWLRRLRNQGMLD